MTNRRMNDTGHVYCHTSLINEAFTTHNWGKLWVPICCSPLDHESQALSCRMCIVVANWWLDLPTISYSHLPWTWHIIFFIIYLFILKIIVIKISRPFLFFFFFTKLISPTSMTYCERRYIISLSQVQE